MWERKTFADCKFWLEETLYCVGQILYTLGEWLAAICYFLLMVFNMLSNNLHNDGVDDERRRLYEEQRKQRYWEEEEQEQNYFEERQRLYALRFGNWQERNHAAITLEERDEANAARDKRGSKLNIVYEDGRTALATSSRIAQMKSESDKRRAQISRLYYEVNYFRDQERVSRDDDRQNISSRVRHLEADIASLERLDRQTQIDLQNVSF